MKNRYTKQEDDIIREQVQLFPDNIVGACELASKILKNRTAKGVYQRYYSFLKKKTIIISVGSRKGFTNNNVKNTPRTKKNPILKSDLKPFQFIVKELLDLSYEDRQKVLNFFN